MSVIRAHFILSNNKTRPCMRLSWTEVRKLALSGIASIILTLIVQNVLWPVNMPSLPCPQILSQPTVSKLSEKEPLHSHKPHVDGLHSKRIFTPIGSGAALFVVYGAYRGGPNTFAVVGLGLKALYMFGNPEFQCLWARRPYRDPIATSNTVRIMQPDRYFGRIYTVVVVNCTFQEPVGTGINGTMRGGALLLDAYHGDGLGKPPTRVVALTEDESTYNQAAFEPPYPHEYFYCGSPLYGNVNARRIREWIAYHIRLFGPRSHFLFHDAGGMNVNVRRVLEPWRQLGFVTIEDVTEQAMYDGYYQNQFLIVNDCLHKTRFLSNWTFFFDVDEYIYISPGQSFYSVMHQHKDHTALQFKQFRMSDKLCQDNRTINDSRFAFERLVYRDMDVDDIEKQTWKHAVQARHVYATGVHDSEKDEGHMEGDVKWMWWPIMRHHHYHKSISKADESCIQVSVNVTSLDGTPYELDTSMMVLGPEVRSFELEHIGPIYNTPSPP